LHLLDRLGWVTTLAAAALLASACAGESARPTLAAQPIASTPAGSPPPAVAPASGAQPPAAATTGGGATSSAHAAAGQAVFTLQCAVCHGDQGQGLVGPAVIGPRAALGKHGTGKGLLEYLSQLMPQTAPGSLPAEQYRQVTGYLLVQNKLLAVDAPLTDETLEAVKLP
jgi:cytochrome c